MASAAIGFVDSVFCCLAVHATGSRRLGLESRRFDGFVAILTVRTRPHHMLPSMRGPVLLQPLGLRLGLISGIHQAPFLAVLYPSAQ